MTDKSITIAIASDLHAIQDNSGSAVGRSHLRVGDDEGMPGRHPIGGLLKLIRDENLKADVLLCPGDLGDKADPEGIRYAWKALHRVGAALGSHLITGTTGNHDVDSRQIHNKFDPVEVLKSLEPPYPFREETVNGRYWMNYFFVYEELRFRLVVLNSSAYHTSGSEEQERGRISVKTLARIQEYLEASDTKQINLFLCHHHPQQHSDLKLGDYDWMREGQELLDLLGSGSFGRWLVVHGHKHHPKLTYAAGGTVSPIVLSAGSLSAALYPDLGTAARNQFYLVTLDRANVDRFGFVGHGQAWDWALSKGWVQASKGSGLPAEFGFGYRGDPVTVAERLAGIVGTSELFPWQGFMLTLPEVSFMLPRDLIVLDEQLQNRHSLRIFFDDNGCPLQVGKIAVSGY